MQALDVLVVKGCEVALAGALAAHQLHPSKRAYAPDVLVMGHV
ncbi:MAG: hypothetical protein ACJA0C_001253 [Candidatus Endobugula sp.]|jgi:hypothetical protein